ncbi:MAG TPA: hypothetical protein VHA82_19785 [Ramlibacter sp.]|uniref:hypothetical protein n=1 Tax=Ramlibacter sp. TaxID=1917967 RepID=UPI002C5C6A43|nr:hypothetical protein [Ramlibacter sp.]HVZ46059.1 hypothetical protein [Ramlibacter sp.]
MPLHGDFVLLRAGRLALVVPQREVGEARHLGTCPARGDGRFAALSEAMTLMRACPPGRFVAAAFAGDDTGVLWCWDELRVLIGARLQAKEIPGMLLAANAPVARYVELDGDVAYLCCARDIARFAMREMSA